MIFSIVIALLIFWIIINFPEIFGGLIILAGIAIVAVIAIIFGGIILKNLDSTFVITWGIGIGAVLVFAFIINGLGLILSGISNLLDKYYDFKTIFKFLSIQLFTAGITHKQKINKIKKINKLVNYGKENQQLAKDRKEEREKQAEIERLDNQFEYTNDAYIKFTDLMTIELSEYINPGYINLEFVNPTREAIYGKIVINANDANSIIKIGVSKDGFKVSEYFSDRVGYESPYVTIYIEKPLNKVRQTAKSTKKLLFRYFKLHPEKLGS
jgi:hypothetical protein